MPNATCSLPGCDDKRLARDMCRRHYNRWHYAGTTDIAPTPSACRMCGGDLPPKPASGPRTSYCSRSCKNRATYVNRKEVIAAARSARRKPFAARACAECESEFVPAITSRQRFCSKKCGRRSANRTRRAMRREAYVEDIHWQVLVAEDGPACYLCGFDVNPADTEVGRYGPEYPTTDHVVPLSRGGRHERSNARLAHLYCNSVKSDRPLEAVV